MAGGGGEEGEFGLQIAPMLDILFVLLLFFMVSAGSQKKERDLVAPLPGPPAPQDSTTNVPININIDANNEVTMNGSGSLNAIAPDIKTPSELELKLASIITDTPDQPIVISPSPLAQHQTVMDVLNACTGAKVKNVAFTSLQSGQ